MGNRAKGRRTKRKRSRMAKTDGPALIVVIAVLAGLLMSYFAAETVFAARAHPFHWAIAAAGTTLGWAAGRIYYQVRGDIV